MIMVRLLSSRVRRYRFREAIRRLHARRRLEIPVVTGNESGETMQALFIDKIE